MRTAPAWPARPAPHSGPAAEQRRASQATAARYGRQGILSRPADQGKQDPNPPVTPGRRGFPGPASVLPPFPRRVSPALLPTPRSTPPSTPRSTPASTPRSTSVSTPLPVSTQLPVPTLAHHPTPRAIRVRRSPR